MLFSTVVECVKPMRAGITGFWQGPASVDFLLHLHMAEGKISLSVGSSKGTVLSLMRVPILVT